MKRTALLSAALTLTLFFVPQVAATTKVPPISLPLVVIAPTVATNFSGGDEVTQLLTTPTNLFLIGTVETTTSPLVVSTPLGGSDGFISALNPQGARVWDLRLGSSGDDVATAGCLDALGNIWVVGASAVPTGTSATPGLNRLTVWEVSATGTLLNTFTKDLTDIDIPSSIAIKGANFIVQGISNKVGFPTFAVTVTPLGAIGTVKSSVTKVAAAPTLFTTISSAYSWQSFASTKPVKGVIGVGSKQGLNYLLKNSLKDKLLKGAYSIQGVPLSLQFQSGIGVILLSQGAGTYFLTVVHTK